MDIGQSISQWNYSPFVAGLFPPLAYIISANRHKKNIRIGLIFSTKLLTDSRRLKRRTSSRQLTPVQG